MKREAK